MQRRKFINRTALGSAAMVGFPSIVPASVLGKDAPSNKINIGQIGCGRIARGHDIHDTIRFDQTKYIAVCDVDTKRADDAKVLVDSFYKEKTGNTNSCKPAGI